MDAVLNINGAIERANGFGLVDVVQFFAENAEATSYTIIINSVGGDVAEGFRIADYIEDFEKPVKTVAQRVYSIANVIYAAGHTREAMEGAEFMLHKAWANLPANADEMRQAAIELDKIDDRIASYISMRTGAKKTDVLALMQVDTYINGDQARGIGLVGNTSPTRLKAAAQFIGWAETITNHNVEMSLKKKLNELFELAGIKAAEPKALEASNITLTLENGDEVFVESEDGDLVGKPTPAPAGRHELADGRVIVVAPGEGDMNVVEAVEEPAEDSAEAMEDDEMPAEETEAMEDEEKEMMKRQMAELQQKLSAQEEELAGYREKAEAQAAELAEAQATVVNALEMVKTESTPPAKNATFSNKDQNTKAYGAKVERKYMSAASKLRQQIIENTKK